MQSFSSTAVVALEEVDRMIDRLDALTPADWEQPTRCEGWDVRGLARHTVAALWQQAEAFHRVRMGSTEAPSWLDLGENEPPAQALRVARGHLVAGLAAVGEDDDPAVPLPFLTLPASIAIQVVLIEYGFHRNDLDWALGEERPLRPEVAQVQVELLPAWLPGAATRVADEGVGFSLQAPSGTTSVVCQDGSWRLEQPAPQSTCTVAGDDSAIALFALGRIGSDHPWLEVDDPPQIAKRFKDYFPGP